MSKTTWRDVGSYTEVLQEISPGVRAQQHKPNNFVDRTDRRYGRLVALAPTTKRSSGLVVWLCRCDCGNHCLVIGANLGKSTNSCGCNFRLPPGEGSFREVERKYKNSAARRGHAWTLGHDQFRALTTQLCHYCGCEPHTTCLHPGANGAYTYNGIDRVNNTKGYTPENVVPCCKTCNRAKLAMDYDEFLKWVEQVCNYRRANP